MPKAVLLTKHQKATWVVPSLKNAGFDVQEYSDFDTDSLGTFCLSIKRKQNAKQTALHKAKLACELTGADYGLGSEGSFSQHVVAGLTWNQEILCLYDKQKQTALYGTSEAAAEVVGFEAEDKDDLMAVASHFGEQKWMWQSPEQAWHKGLSADALLALLKTHKQPFPTQVHPDYRAMYCPSRQTQIGKAAQDLARRLTSTCPKCNAVNFVHTETMQGLPCNACGLPTQQALGWWAECDNCGHREFLKSPNATADPKYCAFCNP